LIFNAKKTLVRVLPRADAWGSDKQKPAFLRPGFVMELRRGLRYATSERKIGVFVKFMKYAGKNLRKVLTGNCLSDIILVVFV